MSSVSSVAALIIGIILCLVGFGLTFIGLIVASAEAGVGAAIVLFGVVFLAGGAFLVYYSQGQRGQAPPQLPPAPSPQPPVASPTIVQGAPATRVIPGVAAGTTTVLAFLEAPNGRLIVSSPTQPFYRSNFQGLVPPGVLETISQSKPQFTIYFRGGRFYIEDSMSTNGTLLNGRQIKGAGMQPLSDGDVISPAGVINLVFRVPA
jgi:hypothetical protein